MTVRRIMILLYGAGGVPGRGEIPMIQISKNNLVIQKGNPSGLPFVIPEKP